MALLIVGHLCLKPARVSHLLIPECCVSELRCYFVAECEFENPTPDPKETDIRKMSAKAFLDKVCLIFLCKRSSCVLILSCMKVSPNTLEIYQQVMNNALQRTGPIVECYEVQGTRERRVVIGYKQGTVKSYFSAMSNLYHFYVRPQIISTAGSLPTADMSLCRVCTRLESMSSNSRMAIPSCLYTSTHFGKHSGRIITITVLTSASQWTSHRCIRLPDHARSVSAVLPSREPVGLATEKRKTLLTDLSS